MSDKGFMEIPREDRGYQLPEQRVKHWKEFVIPLAPEVLNAQAHRCMDCGVPTCHGGEGSGCPTNNEIPEFNRLVQIGQWKKASENLHSTNNFPEITGRVCPAPCEAACVLNIDQAPVTIKTIECAIADKAIEEGWIVPERPQSRTGKKVTIVGSGMAGMACAQQLARVGHEVHIYERHAKAGGLVRYGIPDFKIEKGILDRRVAQMKGEGVTFHYNAHVGVNVDINDLRRKFDAVVLAGGSEVPRDVKIPGRELAGIHFAMEFLPQQNRRVSGEPVKAPDILATGKHVVVLGGGDTGSDCIGTAWRQEAKSVTQLEIMPRPPDQENGPMTWPEYPRFKFRTSSSQLDGDTGRDFAVATQSFSGEDGQVKKLHCIRMNGKERVVGSEFELNADLVLIAAGFTNPVHEGMLEQLGVKFNPPDSKLGPPGCVVAKLHDHRTSVPKVYAAGDMRRGQSLVVWAIHEGRSAAQCVDFDLMGPKDAKLGGTAFEARFG